MYFSKKSYFMYFQKNPSNHTPCQKNYKKRKPKNIFRLTSITNLTSRKAKSIRNNFEIRRTSSFLFYGPVYFQSHLLLWKQMRLQLNEKFSPKLALNIGDFGL